MKTIQVLFLLLLLLPSGISGQTTARHSDVKTANLHIGLAGDSVHISFTLQAVGLASNYRIDVTPILYNGTHQAALTPVRISGVKSLLSQQRKVLFGKHTTTLPTAQHPTISATDTLTYMGTLAWEPWMESLSLRMENRLTGCCSTVILPSAPVAIDVPLCLPTVVQAKEPEPLCEPTAPRLSAVQQLAARETFIRPIEAYAADRQDENYYRDKSALRIYFHQGSSLIDSGYSNNEAVLKRFTHALQVLATDSSVHIVRIVIVGYASVEGTYQHNKELARHRALSLQEFAMKCGVPLAKFRIVNMGEGWDELRDLVEQSTLEDRNEVLRIIDTVPVMKGRKQKLMELRSGNPYRWMMQHLFPLQRNAGYIKVYYDHEQ